MKRRYSSGIVPHASSAAMGFARAVTSHARAHYQKKYHGKFRLPGWVFAFDMTLLACAFLFLIVNIVLRVPMPSMNAGLDIQIQTAEVRSGERVPMIVHVQSADRRIHPNVRIRIVLPEWAELEDQYANRRFINVALGDITPNNPKTISFIAIPYAKAGQEFSIHVYAEQERAWPFPRTSEGIDTRIVSPSLIQVGVFRNCSFTADGLGLLQISGAHLSQTIRLTSEGWLFENYQTEIGLQEADQQYFAVSGSEGHASSVRWEVRGNGFLISEGELTPTVSLDQPIQIVGGLSRIARESGITSEAKENPSLTTATDIVDWIQYPIGTREGQSCQLLSPMSGGSLQEHIHVDLTQQSEAGEQIGAGPLPPVPGETTFAWAKIRIPPTVNAWKNGSIVLKFADGVSWTGKISTSIPSIEARSVSHGVKISIPVISASPDTRTVYMELMMKPTVEVDVPSIVSIESALFVRDTR